MGTEKKEFLPLGSIVILKKGEQKIMIIGRGSLYNNEGTIGYFEYSGCLYPIGQTDQNTLFFNREDIGKVIFTGYMDSEETEFEKVLTQSIRSTNYPKLHLEFEE